MYNFSVRKPSTFCIIWYLVSPQCIYSIFFSFYWNRKGRVEWITYLGYAYYSTQCVCSQNTQLSIRSRIGTIKILRTNLFRPWRSWTSCWVFTWLYFDFENSPQLIRWIITLVVNLWLPADVGVYNLHLHILCMYIEEKYPNQQ